MRYGEDDSNNGEDPFFGDFAVYGANPEASAYRMPTAANFAVTPQASSLAVMPTAAQPIGDGALTPEQITELQASAALMQQRIRAASDPSRNAAFDKYVADQAAKGVEFASTYTGGGGPLGSGGVLGVTNFAPAFDPANPAGTTGQVVRFDPKRMNAPVVFQPGQQYVLTDATGENVVGRASSVEELQKLASAKENMPYGFQLYQADQEGNYKPGTQLFGETDPRTKGLMGAFVNYGLPIAAGIASGGLTLIPAMAASAAASGVSKLMTGYTAGDAAKSAAIAAATRGVLKGTGLEDSLGQILSAKTSGVTSSAIPAGALSGAPMSVIPAGALGGVSASAIPAGAFSGLGSAAAGAVPEIVVTAAKNALASAIPGGFSGAASGGFDQFLSDNAGMIGGEQPQMAETPAEDEILVSNTATPKVDFSGLSALGGAAALPGTAASLELPGEKLIDVAAKRIPDTQLDSALAATTGALATAAPVTEPGEMVVTGKRTPDTELDSTLSGAAAALVPNMPVDTTLPGGDLADSVTEEPKKGGGTLKKVLGGLTLLDILSGALGAGKGGGNTATGGAGKLNPIFSAKLPGASPAFSQQTLAPRPGGVSGAPMSDIDWYRYGYNPERSFFNYVPATEAEREAMMVKPPSPLEVKARGGTIAAKKGGAPAKESFAVKGPGTGRSDEIPALLSDGEYVIDAETVALLGDGSSEAGAKRLDDFRVNVRKHKGSNLARGKFSANAKRPEKYLAGGRV